MRNKVIFISVFLLFGMSQGALGKDGKAFEFSQVERLSIKPGSSLFINNSMGDVEIEFSPLERELVIEAQKVIKEGSKEEATRVAKRLKIDILREDKEIKVVVEPLRVLKILGGLVKFDVRTKAEVEIVSGLAQIARDRHRLNLKILVPERPDINIRAISYGRIRVKNAQGNLALDGREGSEVIYKNIKFKVQDSKIYSEPL